MKQTMEVNVESDGHKVVMARVTYWDVDFALSSTASAVCNEVDTFDETIRTNLAVGRAMRQVARSILHDGQNAVHENDRRRARELAMNEARKARKEQLAKRARKAHSTAKVTAPRASENGTGGRRRVRSSR